jgi:HK97 family phage major capsid protein
MTFSIVPRGLNFTRAAIALALAKGNHGAAAEIADRLWPGTMLAKSLAGVTVAGSWGADFDGLRQANAEFLQLVAQRTVLGRMSGVKQAPPLVRTVTVSSGSTAAWVDEGTAKPMSSLTLDTDTMKLKKVIALVVATEEMLQAGGTKGEILLANDLARAVAKAIDEAFLDPHNAGDTATPASVLYGATEIPSTLTWSVDLKEAISAFDGDLSNAYWVARPEVFAGISSGDHPAVGARGGELLGIPCLPSIWMPNDGASPASDFLALVDASGIVVCENPNVEIKPSRQATVEISTNPSHEVTTPTPSQLVSLWQTNSVGLLVERQINWRMARTGGAVVITGVPR